MLRPKCIEAPGLGAEQRRGSITLDQILLCALLGACPGEGFEFYPSNREGFHKIAHKNFDQHTGKLATDESTNVFSLMQSLRDVIFAR
jgi:hypothetical protein